MTTLAVEHSSFGVFALYSVAFVSDIDTVEIIRGSVVVSVLPSSAQH